MLIRGGGARKLGGAETLRGVKKKGVGPSPDVNTKTRKRSQEIKKITTWYTTKQTHRTKTGPEKL